MPGLVGLLAGKPLSSFLQVLSNCRFDLNFDFNNYHFDCYYNFDFDFDFDFNFAFNLYCLSSGRSDRHFNLNFDFSN